MLRNLFGAALIAFVAVSTPAMARDHRDHVRFQHGRYVVDFADLDLSRSADRQEFRSRLETAALPLCMEAEQTRRERNQCVRQSVDRTLARTSESVQLAMRADAAIDLAQR